MAEIYDLIILGAGPAGITAAIYASRAKLNMLWIEKKFVKGGQIADTYEVDNYPGMPGIGGIDLGEAMAAHAEKLGAVPVRENVVSIELDGEIKIVRTKKSEYHAKALILALGASHRHLGIPGKKNLQAWAFPTVLPVTEPFSRIGQQWSLAEEIPHARMRRFWHVCAGRFTSFTEETLCGQIRSCRRGCLPGKTWRWSGTAFPLKYADRTR